MIRPYVGIKMLELNPMIASQLRQRDPSFPSVEVQQGPQLQAATREFRTPNLPPLSLTQPASFLHTQTHTHSHFQSLPSTIKIPPFIPAPIPISYAIYPSLSVLYHLLFRIPPHC